VKAEASFVHARFWLVQGETGLAADSATRAFAALQL